ncbi:S9 family peptidase [Paenibacillus hemerocallicola]|uniref:S9 family peptidase n=1 Tax=Paenibacillus hemerocallicola TaxID=1172614 RepID=A0A5C4T562_9BACL|nr:S9 family peptidase [Paenibacillus hemerocallicola]TNJ64183.1 S9 family peptidase [Paenibacillus hemerocallicola]
MKKKFVSAVLLAAMLVSVPVSASAADSNGNHAAAWYEASSDKLVKKGIYEAGSDHDAAVSAKQFIDYALTALTYEHGSDAMRQEKVRQWVRAGELADRESPIKRGEIARILVRAMGKETVEKSLDDYVRTASRLGIVNGYPDRSMREENAATLAEAAVMLDNYRNAVSASIDNAGVAPLSVEDFMKNPGSFAYELSPDGNYISYAAEWERRSNVFVKKMDGSGEPVRVSSSKDRDIAAFFWKGERVLYMKDNGGDENYHIYSSAFGGGEEKDLTPYPGVRVGLISYLTNVENEVLIMMNKEDATVFDIYKLNVKTGETKLVAKNPGTIQIWVADHEGAIRLAVESDGVVGKVLYRDKEDEPFRPFISLEAGEQITPIAFSKDNQSIYALSNKGRDKIELVKFDLKANEQVLFSDPNVDITGAFYDSKQDKLLYAAYMTDKVHYRFFDGKLETVFRDMLNKLNASESEVGINDYSKDMTKFIVSVSNDKSYGTYYYYDSVTGDMTELANLSPWLKPEQLADMHPISYKSRDGLTIHGYLTLPKNKTAENLPLIVNPHGGPWYRDSWGFNPEVQLLANRGYAVLQINFRSSTGYGKQFLEAGNKQWGLSIQNDITDGVQWAIKQGIADPERVGIYGASFGGYAALAGITFTPDLYAAAVDYVGVSNIFTLLQTLPPYWESYRNMFYERVGHPEKDKELLQSASPVFHADKIVTPLFVAQGANDPRVNKAESDQIVEALKQRGIEVEYMVKDNEGHGFTNEENRIDFYNAMIRFLDTHLK